MKQILSEKNIFEKYIHPKFSEINIKLMTWKKSKGEGYKKVFNTFDVENTIKYIEDVLKDLNNPVQKHLVKINNQYKECNNDLFCILNTILLKNPDLKSQVDFCKETIIEYQEMRKEIG